MNLQANLFKIRFNIRKHLIIFLIVSFYLLLLIKSSAISPDLKVFIEQSERMFSGGNVYFPGDDYVAYNSSLLYLIVFPLTYLTLDIASKVFLLINIIIATKIYLILSSEFRPSLEFRMKNLIFFVVFFHYSTRSIINNGQVGLIVVLSILIIWKNLNVNENKIEWLIALNLFIAFELKPYLVTLCILYFFIAKKYSYLLKAFIIEIIYQVLILIFFPSANFLQYLKRLFYRSGIIGAELDQSSLYVLSKRLFINSELISVYLFICFNLLVVLVLIKFQLNKNSNTFLLTTGASVLVSPYFHRQDALLLSIAYIVSFLVYKTKLDTQLSVKNTFTFVSVGLMFQYGGSNLTGIFVVSFFWLLFLSNLGLKIETLIILVFFNAGINLYIYMLYNKHSYILAYKFWTILVLVSSVIQFIHSLYFMKKEGCKNFSL